MKMNPLEALFQDIQRDQQVAKGHRKPPPALPFQSTYANPENWTPGKAVEIRHFTQGSLGVFREYFHRLSPTARRLLPAPQGTEPTSQELVFGDWWLHARNQAPTTPDTDQEIQAVVARFQELIDEYDEE